MIKVLLADDHQIVLDGLSMLLEMEDDIELVAGVLDGDLVLSTLTKNEIDVAILDIEMPIKGGIETAKIIREKYPNTKVLILTMYNREEFITQLIQIGVSGYILKNRGKEELVSAIRKVYNGGEYFGDAVTKVIITGIREKKNSFKHSIQLTRREEEVLKLIAQGLSTPQISEKLFIANSTVDTHRRNLIDKLDVPNSKALMKYAIENGLV